MLISTKKKALILRLRNPERITAVIPKAKIFDHKGKQFVAVKHGVDEVKVLRNMGIQAPSPIKHYYGWPGRFKPFFAQRETADFLTSNNRGFVLNDIGTGKTLSCLWAYDYLRSVGWLTKSWWLHRCPRWSVLGLTSVGSTSPIWRLWLSTDHRIDG